MSKTSVQSAFRPRVRFAVPAVAVIAALIVAGCSKAPEVDHEVTASLIQPVAQIVIERVQIAAGNRTGAEIYQALCTSCHANGLLGAPTTGNSDEWAPRLAKGFEVNVASVINGLGAMPARAGSPDLTDTEVERAVAYLLNTAGGNYTEPPIEE